MYGEIIEILDHQAFPNIVIAMDIHKMEAHYHNTFDEIYFVLDGEIYLKLYDPVTKEMIEQRLTKNELCIITKETHHCVTKFSEQNRLCVISVPTFDPSDEHPSDCL